MSALGAALAHVGAVVLERGWLSSNNVVFLPTEGPAAVVDTGYAAHASQTVSLIEKALGGRVLGRVVNTHLHSDHCGGNAALQARFGCAVHVPEASYGAADRWDEPRLTFQATGQRCDRFLVMGTITPGTTVTLGDALWEVHGCSGHDADAVMLFEPRHRVLISGDALWEHRVPILFDALVDPSGFDAALGSLAAIEALKPAVVIPGHGSPFSDVSAALERSRERINSFRTGRSDHLLAARRSLTMFHFLEHRCRSLDELRGWASRVTVFGGRDDWLEHTLDGLIAQGLLRRHGDQVSLSSR